MIEGKIKFKHSKSIKEDGGEMVLHKKKKLENFNKKCTLKNKEFTLTKKKVFYIMIDF
jgi:hypothetical protein